MRAPFRESPTWLGFDEGMVQSDPPNLSVYPTEHDDEADDPEPALLDAEGRPLRYFGKAPFGFTRDRS